MLDEAIANSSITFRLVFEHNWGSNLHMSVIDIKGIIGINLSQVWLAHLKVKFPTFCNETWLQFKYYAAHMLSSNSLLKLKYLSTSNYFSFFYAALLE